MVKYIEVRGPLTEGPLTEIWPRDNYPEPYSPVVIVHSYSPLSSRYNSAPISRGSLPKWMLSLERAEK